MQAGHVLHIRLRAGIVASAMSALGGIAGQSPVYGETTEPGAACVVEEPSTSDQFRLFTNRCDVAVTFIYAPGKRHPDQCFRHRIVPGGIENARPGRLAELIVICTNPYPDTEGHRSCECPQPDRVPFPYSRKGRSPK